MISQPSYRLIPLDVVLATVRSVEDLQARLAQLATNRQARRHFERQTAKCRDTQENIAFLKRVDDAAALTFAEWLRAGKPSIAAAYWHIGGNPEEAPEFVLRTWACYKLARAAGEGERWLVSLPQEVADLVTDIEKAI
jgi:hypothetical protein